MQDSSAISSVCVFAGSSPGARPDYAVAARQLGSALARRGLALVYGGGAVGLMGALADAALADGGRVTGVIPQFLLDREIAKRDASELIVVDSMHERKLRMFELADAFVAVPGGLGTLEELFEMLTWAQLGRHAKPCALLNVAGYYDSLLSFLETSVEERFVRDSHRALLSVAADVPTLLNNLKQSRPPNADKWIDRDRASTGAGSAG